MNSTVLSKGDAIEVEMNMDYRYFFMSNQLYYDELSNMSLLYANSIYMKDSGIKIEDANNQENKNLRIKELMQFYGFKDVKTYYMGSEKNDGYEEGDLCRNYPDTHKGRIAIGHKEIEYHGLKKTIVGIVTRGTAEDDDWDNDFDIGDLKLREGIVQVAKPGYENYSVDNEEEKSSNNTQENEKEKSSKNTLAIDGYLKSDNNNNKYDHKYNTELAHFAYGYPDWTNEYHHAGFDIVANRQLEVINEYKEEYNSKMNKDDICFWITGHSMGGAVANLIGASLVNKNKNNVYCYTFAAPNTFYTPDNTKINPKGNKYSCIFNIVNDDDFVPKVPMEDCNWTKYGQEARVSVRTINGLKNIIDRQYQALNNLDRFKYVQYNGSSNACKIIIDSLVGIYNNDYSMREDTYQLNDNDSIIAKFNNVDYSDKARNRYTKPYQKNRIIWINFLTTSIYDFIQTQMPAYFMQVLAGAMHNHKNTGKTIPVFTPFFNRLSIISTPLANRYQNTAFKILMLNFQIPSPHYLEAYYILTKNISNLNFKR